MTSDILNTAYAALYLLFKFSYCLLWRFVGYVRTIFNEVINLRTKYTTLVKASAHAKKILPPEPCTLVEKYLAGKERPSKEEVVSARHSRCTKPALPTNTESSSCFCKGKCATRACDCKSKQRICNSDCRCSEIKCKNREWQLLSLYSYSYIL